MPTYYFKAKNKSGAVVRDSLYADSPWLARKALMQRGYIVLQVTRFNPDLFSGWFRGKFNPAFREISLDDRLFLISQMETGFSVGIPIIQVLEMIAKEFENRRVRKALTGVVADLNEGKSLHEACSNQPMVFDPISLGMIKTGEMTGELDKALGRIAKITEQRSENQRKIKSAMFYPKIVVTVMVGMVGAVVYFVIPKIKEFLANFNQELPPITKMVVTVSDFFVQSWPLVFGGAFAITVGYKLFVTSDHGRELVDRIKLRMPVLGQLMMFFELNNYCIVLDMLVQSGIPILDAFDTLRGSQSNVVIMREIDRFKAEIGMGRSLSGAIQRSKVFPQMFSSMISIGEEAGMLSRVLQRLGKFYQDQIDYRLDNLSKLIEPIMLSIIFVLVLVIALAVFLPIWKMSSAVRGG